MPCSTTWLSAGLLANTIVYCTGEFGRTPTVNANAGRDHWARTMTALVAGGGLKSGHVHGATDFESHEPINSPCSPDDLSTTIFHQLGFPPSHTLPTRSGRPVMLFRSGKVIEELIALIDTSWIGACTCDPSLETTDAEEKIAVDLLKEADWTFLLVEGTSSTASVVVHRSSCRRLLAVTHREQGV